MTLMLSVCQGRARLERKQEPSNMPKKERKRLQVVISEEQDALLTKTAYELSSPERLISKSEVVRLAIEKIAREMGDGESIEDYKALLEEEEVRDE